MQLPVAVGDLVADKYRIEERVGGGAMGIVFAARHVELGERVALKFLNPLYASDEQARTRFQREAKNTFALKSEHVARVLDVGKLASGEPFIVMEFLSGVTLKQHVEARGVLPREESLSIVQQICEGVAEAHGSGIVHRDIKPENVFLTTLASGATIVKVLDFGISKSKARGAGGAGGKKEMAITADDQVLGTPRYMAPEQLSGSGQASTASDVWSIGVIAYWLLCGAFPYDGGSPQLTMAKLFGSEDAEDVGAKVPELDPGLARVVMKCLARDAALRFPDAEALRRAVRPFCRSSATLTQREPTPPTQRSAESDASALPERAPSVRVVEPAPETIRETDRMHSAAPSAELDARHPPPSTDLVTAPLANVATNAAAGKKPPLTKTLPLGMVYANAAPIVRSKSDFPEALADGAGQAAPDAGYEGDVTIPMTPQGRTRVYLVLGIFAFVAFVVWLLKTR